MAHYSYNANNVFTNTSVISTVAEGNHYTTVYMVENFWRTKLSQLGHRVSIHGKLLRLHQNNDHKCQNSLKFAEKHSRSKQKPRNPQKFCPSNVLYYKVLYSELIMMIIVIIKFQYQTEDMITLLHTLGRYVGIYINNEITVERHPSLNAAAAIEILIFIKSWDCVQA